jgi:hypothetical protein
MKFIDRSKLLSYVAASFTLIVFSGCDRDSVKVYKVDSKSPSTASSAATMPATMPTDIPVPDNSGLPNLKYTLPAGWKEKALTQMRVASFEVSENGKTADISVIPLGGMSGSDLANVNRWRGQVGLGALDEAGLQQLAEAVEICCHPAMLYDIARTNADPADASRILGAIFRTEETSWFFKMVGEASLVASQKANFIAFLKSTSFHGVSAPAAMDLGQLPPSHPPIPGMNTGSQPPSEPATPKTDQ